MNTKKKITKTEQLQQMKIRLQGEADAHMRALDHHIDYLQSNWGTLLVGSVLTTAKSKLPILKNILPEKNVSETVKVPARKKYLATNLLVDQAIDALPLFFKGYKPFFIAFALKQIKKVFFDKKLGI